MLSIIVAIYNVEKYVEKAIQSIMAQTYQDTEILLVDDGSTDGSGRICDEYAQKDNRITVIHKKNGGLSDARNAGLEKAKGDYVAFVDGDDYLHPKMYEVLMRSIGLYKADMAICEFQTVEEAETPEESLEETEEKIHTFSGREMYAMFDRLEMTVAWNKVYKKSLFAQIHYPVGRLHEDESVIHHLAGASKTIVFIERKMYYYVVRNGSIMSRMNLQRIEDMKAAMEDRILFFKAQEEPLLAQKTAYRLVNSLIMFDQTAHQKNDAGKKKVRKEVKKALKELLSKDAFFEDREGRKARKEVILFLIAPALCKAYRWWIDVRHRGVDKLQRMLHLKK